MIFRERISLGIILISLVVAFAYNAHAEPLLKITQGSIQVGGPLSFSIDMQIPETGDNLLGYQMGIYPSFGYFVVDGLEIMGAINTQLSFGDLYEKVPMQLGVTVGGRYIFDLSGVIFPYIGIMVGPDFVFVEGESVKTSLAAGLPLGVLWAVNKHVAISIGISGVVSFGLSKGMGTQLKVPMGLLGIEGFF